MKLTLIIAHSGERSRRRRREQKCSAGVLLVQVLKVAEDDHSDA